MHSLLPYRMFTTQPCLQHLCSLQPCKSQHLFQKFQRLCSNLANWLPATMPYNTAKFYTDANSHPIYHVCHNTAYHISTSPYLLMPAGKIAQTLAIIPSDTWFSTMAFSSKPTLPCQHHLLCQALKPNTWLHAQPLWPTLTTSACYSSI